MLRKYNKEFVWDRHCLCTVKVNMMTKWMVGLDPRGGRRAPDPLIKYWNIVITSEILWINFYPARNLCFYPLINHLTTEVTPPPLSPWVYPPPSPPPLPFTRPLQTWPPTATPLPGQSRKKHHIICSKQE